MQNAAPPSRPAGRRRTLRKGTFSCRECKKGKRRCEIPAGQSDCVGCRRRGLPCLSQAHDEDEDMYREVEGSLTRVERLVAGFLRQRQSTDGHNPPPIPELFISGLRSQVPRSLSGASTSTTTYLQSVFPSPSEVAAILCNGRSSRIPTRMLWSGTKPPIPSKADRPPPGAHPIWFGRSLMQLALCLQDSATVASGQDASRFADIVARNVTSLDVMADSVEGIEVLMLEAMYHVNSDNRRVAWLKCRRAISIAQMLGIDGGEQGDYASSLWFRLLYGDRILSLELGLPHTILAKDLYGVDDPERQLENMDASLCARIVSRNMRMQQHGGTYEWTETREIERQMSMCMNHLPVEWWVVPAQLCSLPEDDAMAETARLTRQMNHFWILVNLYQPYIAKALLFPDGSKEELLAMVPKVRMACREVLHRYIPLRKYHQGTFYHGLDFKAYFACVNLLLAQMVRQRHLKSSAIPQSDRQRNIRLIQEALQYMDDDRMSESTGLTIRDLLRIDDTSASSAEIGWSRYREGGKKLHIPFVGVLYPLNHGALGDALPSLAQGFSAVSADSLAVAQ